MAGWTPPIPFHAAIGITIPLNFPAKERRTFASPDDTISFLRSARGSTFNSIHTGPLAHFVQVAERPQTGTVTNRDFSRFNNLTFLSLSPCITSYKFGWVNILAPRLETFEWAFMPRGPLHTAPVTLTRTAACNLHDFQQPAEDFLRQLARTLSNSNSPPLRTVRVVYSPLPGFVASHDGDLPETTVWPSLRLGCMRGHTEYPWDRMARLEEEMRLLGIKFEYNPPNMTRDVFDGIFARYIRAREQSGR
ncbi:hypothetical protein QBC44DRAFT_398129 [Cladorrhinum sp. PSN332]|nr:hypothetical protein QBC44DRAFT_398129 [Cladorrhinum sp. PSN332]